jgi:hypothetical protein
LTADPDADLTDAQFLALWGAMPAPLLRLLDLYLLHNPDVPAPHARMDRGRFQADFRDWYRRSADQEVRGTLREAVAYFAGEGAPGPG